MISYLSGIIIDKTESSATVLVGGVGYEVNLPSSVISKIKKDEEASFYVYTHVREDILALYGFQIKEELEFFKLLLSVSGIGPKVALSIIGASPIEKLKNSISKGDPALLSAVSGVGKKTAEKAVVELKSKLGDVNLGSQIFDSEGTDEVVSALLSLGFQKSEISDVLDKIPSDLSTDEKIKEALKLLGKK